MVFALQAIAMANPTKAFYRIRKARLADLESLTRLLGQLFEQEAEFHADPALQKAGLRRLLKPKAPAGVFVAEARGQVLGMVSLLLITSTALGKPVALLEDLVVDAAWRGQGLGSALLDHALSQAYQLGLGRVTLLTDPGNRRAQKLYHSRGFKKSPMLALRWAPEA
jgi:ribosomal protein S18 acetylase RimI-like enzyme